MKLKGSNLLQPLVALASLTAYLTLIIPIQTYYGNIDYFSAYSLGEYIPELMILFLIGLSVFSALLWLSGDFVRKIVGILAFAILLCIYIEVGFLSHGLPPLDGGISFYNNAFRRIFDLAVFGIVFCAVVALFHLINKWVHWASLAILLLGIASIFDVYVKPAQKSANEFSFGMCSKYEAACSVRYSPRRNIIMLILDSVPGTVVTDIATNSLEIAEKFSGFVAYRNNIGMHEATVRGIPGLLHGHYFEKESTYTEHLSRMYSKDSFLYPYLIDDLPIFFCAGVDGTGFTNRPVQKTGDEEYNRVEKAVFKVMQGMDGSVSLSLLDVVAFRVLPFAVKRYILLESYRKHRKIAGFTGEDFLYPIIARNANSQDDKTALTVVHTYGTHVPFYHDKCGKALASARVDVDGLKDMAYYMLVQVGELFDDLKKRDLYDSSFIIICADHGSPIMSTDPELMGQPSAMLWVKPARENGSFRVSDMPTGHSKISKLMKAVKDKDLSRREVDSILHTEVRLFRGRPQGKLEFYDYIFGPGGELLEKKNVGVFKGE